MGDQMKISIGSDHGGFHMKEQIKKDFLRQGIEVEDFGCPDENSVDYPVIARTVAENVAKSPGKLGILVCGTGIGMAIAANKVKGIRAAVCHDEYTVNMSRNHNDANILCIGGRVLQIEEAMRLVNIFIRAQFSNDERHKRRISEIE
jgi:ribose 5-phosphate isomerase B